MTESEDPKFSELSLPNFLEKLGISIAFRITDALDASDGAAGQRLEADLKGIASFSWAQNNNLAQQFIDDINSCPEEKWSDGVTAWLASNADLNIEAIRREYPLYTDIIDWCPKCKARFILSHLSAIIGDWDSVDEFSAWTRQFFLDLLAKGAKGLISTKWLDGLFTTDLGASQKKINELLLATGGDKMVTEVCGVAKSVHKTLSKDPVIRLVLELIEAQARITLGSEESTADLKSLVDRTHGHLRYLGMTLPGNYEVFNKTDIRTYAEDRQLIEDSITYNLLVRIQSDPDQLIRDATEKRLYKWLLVTTEHDFRDRIEFFRAAKRDVAKEISFDAPLKDEESDGKSEKEKLTLHDIVASTEISPQDEAASSITVDRIMALFNPLELEIVDLILKHGADTAEVSRHYGRDFKWAKRKIDGIRGKVAKWKQAEDVANGIAK